MVVSIVHVRKAREAGLPILDGRPVDRISAYVVAGDLDRAPAQLASNEDKAFIGSYLLGMGFTFDDVAAAKGEAEPISEMHRLIKTNARNAERIKPYIGGEEVNNSPAQAHHRYAIDFESFPRERNLGLKAWSESSSQEKQSMLAQFVVSKDYPGPVAETRKGGGCMRAPGPDYKKP